MNCQLNKPFACFCTQALGSVLDPMVMVPFIVKSGDMTRDVAVERSVKFSLIFFAW